MLVHALYGLSDEGLAADLPVNSAREIRTRVATGFGEFGTVAAPIKRNPTSRRTWWPFPS
jgi:hypothetical protein